jgi:transposase-like protein
MSLLHPRSTLHALPAVGLDTPEVESLTSYFCRLAYSHGMTAQKLADWMLDYFEIPVCDRYGWHQRSFSSQSAESEQWAAWLAELTSIGALDRLTLAPWRHLVGMPGLAPRSDRWCPCCLSEDRAGGSDPYLRLIWDVAPVSVCVRHKVELCFQCPHCAQTNVRNRAAIVVPGYCTACGGFLGDASTDPATPESLWVARQVGLMLQTPPKVTAEERGVLLETVIRRMADGCVGTFARRYGFSKSGIWHWINRDGVPSLRAWLTIALQGGIGLDRLFAGDIDGWTLPRESVQMALALPESPRAGIRSKELNWNAIRASLQEMLVAPEPVALHEACTRLGVSRKQLYLRANTEARAIADRYRRHQASQAQQREERVHVQIDEVLNERLSAGYDGMSARDLWSRCDTEIQSVSSVFSHIQAVLKGRQD